MRAYRYAARCVNSSANTSIRMLMTIILFTLKNISVFRVNIEIYILIDKTLCIYNIYYIL